MKQNKKRYYAALIFLCILIISICSAWTVNQPSAFSDVDSYSVKDWASATYTLRSVGQSEAFLDADGLFCVESINGSTLKVHAVYRSIDESGTPQPEVMFSDEDDPIWKLVVEDDAIITILLVEPECIEAESASGALSDIVAGDIISIWGAYDDSAGAYTAERIAIWKINKWYTMERNM